MGSGHRRRIRAAQRLNRILDGREAPPATPPTASPERQLTPAQGRLELALHRVEYLSKQVSLYRERYESQTLEIGLLAELAKLQIDDEVKQSLAAYAECVGRRSEALEEAVAALEALEAPPVPDVQTAVGPEAVDEVLEDAGEREIEEAYSEHTS